MAATSPTMEPLDLGDDHTLRFTHWAPERDLNPQYEGIPDIDPVGAIIDHRKPDGTTCSGALTFYSPAARRLFPERQMWTVESLQPLTLSPSISCGGCGDHGHVREGKWVPA